MEAICTSPYSPEFSPLLQPRELSLDEVEAVAGGVFLTPALITAVINLASSYFGSTSCQGQSSGSTITIQGSGSTCNNCTITVTDENVTVSGN